VPAVLAYVIALVVAVAVVPLTGGRYARLAEIEFHRGWLLAVGLGLQIALDFLELPEARYDDLGVAILLLSYVALLGFCASNLTTKGFVLIGIGIALNALVIALNLGMPYKVSGELPRETTVKHRPTRDSDVAVFLSDQLTIGDPVNVAISIGDVVLGAGIVHFAYAGSRSRRRTRPPSRFVDLPAIERAEAVERGRQPAEEPTTRSSASNTLRS
jgi:hypothetical protein